MLGDGGGGMPGVAMKACTCRMGAQEAHLQLKAFSLALLPRRVLQHRVGTA